MTMKLQNEMIAYILPNGKCSNCNEKLRKEDGEWIITKNRLIRQNKINGDEQILCPKCKEFINFRHVN